jgi:hypothetical protein
MLARTLAVLGYAACSVAPKHAVPVSLVVEGDRAAVGALGPGDVEGLELRVVDVPPVVHTPPSSDAPAITKARSAYASGEFDTCRAHVAPLDLVAMLSSGRRDLAARALALDAACAWGGLAKTDAQRIAARFASFGLELPAQVVAPDVEAMIGEASAAAGRSPRHAITIRGVQGARLSLDGRAAGCVLPCTLDVASGDHVLAAFADGFVDAARLVRVPETTSVELSQPPASPELAARQWRARRDRGAPTTDPTGLALLARVARAPRIAVLYGSDRLDGALLVDGVIRARGVRDRGEGATLVRELAYDSGVLERPSVLQRPWFWIVVSGLTLAVAGATVAYIYEPETRTVIR